MRLIFAHLFGDYIFQNKKMALKKTTSLLWCTIHCLIYTICFAVFYMTLNVAFLSLIFVSHWSIDRWGLGGKWLELIGGRDLLTAFLSKDQYREFDVAFSCIVYTVVDNTFHLFIAYLGAMYLL